MIALVFYYYLYYSESLLLLLRYYLLIIIIKLIIASLTDRLPSIHETSEVAVGRVLQTIPMQPL